MSWIVYKHISPSGKVYVGITSNVKKRWAANGYYYHLSDTIFSRALKKYGWNSFKHIIVYEGLTKERACAIEIELIAYYKDRNMSYNIAKGGVGYSGNHSLKHIEHRTESRINNNKVDYLVIDQEFNYIICDTQKEVADFLGGNQRNVSHLLNQPIGYTFHKHYIWKHKKGTSVDIDYIREQIEEALLSRHNKLVCHIKANINKMIENSKAERKNLSDEVRKTRYKSNGMLGKKHSMETKNKMSQSARNRNNKK